MGRLKEKLEKAGRYLDRIEDGAPYEEMADAYQSAWELTDTVAREAINESDSLRTMLGRLWEGLDDHWSSNEANAETIEQARKLIWPEG